MQTVPLQPVPSQTLAVNLGGQACQISVYQKLYGLFVDLYVDNGQTPIIVGVLAENLNRIVRSAYLGFQGDLAFQDTQGSRNPDWSGLGTRYLLRYLTAADLAALDLAA